MKVPENYDTFMNMYPDGIILIAFGTTWRPDDNNIANLVAAAKKLPNIGFIISLKKDWGGYKIVEKANLPNMFLDNFIPQIELLNDERVFGFVSHGGGNSIVESLYYGKVLIGLPSGVD